MREVWKEGDWLCEKNSLLFLSSNEVFRKAGVSLNRKEGSDEDYKERQVTRGGLHFLQEFNVWGGEEYQSFHMQTSKEGINYRTRTAS